MPYTFTPPVEMTGSSIAYDQPPEWNRLMRYFGSPRPSGRAVWQLADGTYSFTQPFPTIEDTGQNRADLHATVEAHQWSNRTAVTYRRVFYGGHTYTVTDADEVAIAAFLVAQGYTAADWLVLQ